MKITIFGSGYVGLVTGICFAEVGNEVLAIDIDEQRIEQLQRGEVPIYEPGLAELLRPNLEAGRISFSTDAALGVAHGLFQIIAVGTPPDADGSADLQYVLAVAQTIGEYLDDYRVIINKSTVPVGTADLVRNTIQRTFVQRGKSFDFDVVSNPEFLKEGAAIDDFMKPDRIIVGTNNSRTTELLRELYAPFNRNRDRLIVMDIRSAELTKYAANAMLATRISFMNELANIAERLGANIERVRIGIGSDPRIGYSFIYPGCGYGGSCFPKDVRALIHTAQSIGYNAELLQAIETVNIRQKQILFTKIQKHFSDNLSGRTLALWGLAFKPGTNDMREAPSRTLMELLWEKNVRIQAFDPEANNEALRIYGSNPNLILAQDPYAALEGADALIILTEWNMFRSPDFKRIRSMLNNPVIFDGRNLYEPFRLAQDGFFYYSIGRVNI